MNQFVIVGQTSIIDDAKDQGQQLIDQGNGLIDTAKDGITDEANRITDGIQDALAPYQEYQGYLDYLNTPDTD